jgi:hypothetical protein
MFTKSWKWIWANLGNIVQIFTWLGAFALSAWAVKTATMFSEYAPASWIGAGFIGVLIVSTSVRLLASARRSWIRSKYDNAMMARGGLVDPLANTFERKRIYLNEFVLPSHPRIEGKTFIGCEIVGPSNVMFVEGNNAFENKYPICDAIPLREGEIPYNAIFLTNCTFRQCSFQRVTFLISHGEYEHAQDINWFHWIGNAPEQPRLPLAAPEAIDG